MLKLKREENSINLMFCFSINVLFPLFFFSFFGVEAVSLWLQGRVRCYGAHLLMDCVVGKKETFHLDLHGHFVKHQPTIDLATTIVPLTPAPFAAPSLTIFWGGGRGFVKPLWVSRGHHPCLHFFLQSSHLSSVAFLVSLSST